MGRRDVGIETNSYHGNPEQLKLNLLWAKNFGQAIVCANQQYHIFRIIGSSSTSAIKFLPNLSTEQKPKALMVDLSRLSGSEALALIRCGAVTVEDYTMSLLSRIRERDHVVQAWAYLDPDLIIAEARKMDQIPMKERGPLHGLPVGIKDVAQTRGSLRFESFAGLQAHIIQICQQGTIPQFTSGILVRLLMRHQSSSSALPVLLSLVRQQRLNSQLPIREDNAPTLTTLIIPQEAHLPDRRLP